MDIILWSLQFTIRTHLKKEGKHYTKLEHQYCRLCLMTESYLMRATTCYRLTLVGWQKQYFSHLCKCKPPKANISNKAMFWAKHCLLLLTGFQPMFTWQIQRDRKWEYCYCESSHHTLHWYRTLKSENSIWWTISSKTPLLSIHKCSQNHRLRHRGGSFAKQILQQSTAWNRGIQNNTNLICLQDKILIFCHICLSVHNINNSSCYVYFPMSSPTPRCCLCFTDDLKSSHNSIA